VRLDRAHRRAVVTIVCRGAGACSGRVELRAARRKVGVAVLRLAAGKRRTVSFRVRKLHRVPKLTAVVVQSAKKSQTSLLTEPVNPV
jgi:hypothetical protein